jgi:dihydrofolate reductase
VISLVVAHSRNRVIGRDGGLPWRLPGDMRHFRELTTGHTVLMGRRTYASLPDSFRPLPGRRNLVLSRDPAYRAEGAEVFGDLATALAACGGECFVIGGAQTYEESLPLAARLHATEIDAEIEGDVFFPAIGSGWQLLEQSERLSENDLDYTISTYERTATPL